MGSRDEFRERTKHAVALRAGYLCSFEDCGRPTVGPSEESTESVTLIGKAAHISAAAPGRGSRRYRSEMTTAQRKHIDNAIWLCSDHADLIDRDEVKYTIEALQEMKRLHEAAQAIAVQTRTNQQLGTGLLAVGPDAVCVGDLESIGSTKWALSLRHFVLGDVHQLITFIGNFATVLPENRYVLSNELGDGRSLSDAPTLSKPGGEILLTCPIESAAIRLDVHRIGSMSAVHPETNDMYIKDGQIARVSGLEAFPQILRSALSMQRGENVFAPRAGVRFFEYFEDFKGSLWLSRLMMLDVVREASIPAPDVMRRERKTPLPSITRVRSFELLSEIPNANRLPVRAGLELQGFGSWEGEFGVYMPPREEMEERQRIVAQRPTLSYFE
jgi:hypothetical protein